MAKMTEAQKKVYEQALERAMLETKQAGKKAKSAAEVVVRDLSQNLVTKGSKVQIPDLGENHIYKIFPGAVGGEYFVASDGSRVWLSSLTRGAKPIEGGDYVKPKGTAVESAQTYTSWQKFLIANRGKWLHFEDYSEETVKFNSQPEPTLVKVWTVNFCEEPTE
jgi:DNA-binding beta-propeller fold protein YncE